MSRIASTFDRLRHRGRKALIPFVTAGDPDPAITVPLMHALAGAGADIIELGVPFSDPMADGPVIQRASERALRRGVSLRSVLGMVREFRASNDATPVVLMGYANPVESMGTQAFVTAARQAGVDGVLIVDYPPEESEEWSASLAAGGVDPIFLISPTTPPERIRRVGRLGRGYVYYVSLKGVTGASHLDVESLRAHLPEVQAQVPMPVGVGFGIRDAQSAAAVARLADAVVVGSRLVQELESSPADQAVGNVARLVQSFRDAMDAAA